MEISFQACLSSARSLTAKPPEILLFSEVWSSEGGFCFPAVLRLPVAQGWGSEVYREGQDLAEGAVCVRLGSEGSGLG